MHYFFIDIKKCRLPFFSCFDSDFKTGNFFQIKLGVKIHFPGTLNRSVNHGDLHRLSTTRRRQFSPKQRDVLYPPAFPGSLVDVEASSGATKDGWLNILQPQKVAQAQLDLFQLLRSAYYAPLGQYHPNRHYRCAIFTDPKVIAPDGPLARFQSTLKDIEKSIQARNKTRVPYTFLLPSNIPASINI